MKGHVSINLLFMAASAFASPSPSEISSNLVLATINSASLGHGRNQSIVQQFTREGNITVLVLNFSPTGDIATTICNYCLNLCIKKFHGSP